MRLLCRVPSIGVLVLLVVACGAPGSGAAQDGGEADGGAADLYVVRADGSDQALVARDVMGPIWSPDGSKIAFLRQRGNGVGVFVVDRDGGGETLVAGSPRFVSSPVWSPTGERIAFVGQRGGEEMVFVMAADGSSGTLVPLMDPELEDRSWAIVGYESPAWSPDGERLAFAAWDGNGSEIYMVNADGTGRVKLTEVVRTGWNGATRAVRGSPSLTPGTRRGRRTAPRWPLRSSRRSPPSRRRSGTAATRRHPPLTVAWG